MPGKLRGVGRVANGAAPSPSPRASSTAPRASCWPRPPARRSRRPSRLQIACARFALLAAVPSASPRRRAGPRPSATGPPWWWPATGSAHSARPSEAFDNARRDVVRASRARGFPRRTSPVLRRPASGGRGAPSEPATIFDAARHSWREGAGRMPDLFQLPRRARGVVVGKAFLAAPADGTRDRDDLRPAADGGDPLGLLLRRLRARARGPGPYGAHRRPPGPLVLRLRRERPISLSSTPA